MNGHPCACSQVHAHLTNAAFEHSSRAIKRSIRVLPSNLLTLAIKLAHSSEHYVLDAAVRSALTVHQHALRTNASQHRMLHLHKIDLRGIRTQTKFHGLLHIASAQVYRPLPGYHSPESISVDDVAVVENRKHLLLHVLVASYHTRHLHRTRTNTQHDARSA